MRIFGWKTEQMYFADIKVYVDGRGENRMGALEAISRASKKSLSFSNGKILFRS